jgi:hypothetical protein
MALRTTVSRVVARGVAVEPAVTAEEVETSAEASKTTPRTVGNRYAGASRVPPEPEKSEDSSSSEEAPKSSASAPENTPKARRGRPAGSSNKAKNIGVLPAVTGTETVADIRAKIKAVEATIKETRARHDEEMKALKTVYADLHSQLFYHVK